MSSIGKLNLGVSQDTSEVVREAGSAYLTAEEAVTDRSPECVVSIPEDHCEGQPPVSYESVTEPMQEAGPADDIDIRALSLSSFASIKKIYSQFQVAGTISVGHINEATVKLLELKKCYLNMCDSDPESAESLKQDLDLAETQVKEMNRCDALTAYDLVVFGSFFTPPDPREGPYVDRITGDRYVRPDSSHLFSFGNFVKTKGEYEVNGFNKELIITTKDEFGNPVKLLCDHVYIEKKVDQIQFESGEVNIKNSSDIRKRIKKQEELINEESQILERKIKIWGYNNFILCGRDKLLELGFSEENANKYHAIFLVYTKLLEV